MWSVTYMLAMEAAVYSVRCELILGWSSMHFNSIVRPYSKLIKVIQMVQLRPKMCLGHP